MAGNLENVGYAKPGRACLYNIGNMEETASVLALGAGAITKWLYDREASVPEAEVEALRFANLQLRIERAPNVRNVEQYIARVDEMAARKRALIFLEEARAMKRLACGAAAAAVAAWRSPAAAARRTRMRARRIPIATITMDDGAVMRFELMLSAAPNTVANFAALANEGFYDGLEFFRVVPGVLIQAGDPRTTTAPAARDTPSPASSPRTALRTTCRTCAA